MLPVNPAHDRILDRPCFATVEVIPAEVILDVVVIFRRPSGTLEMVESIIRRARSTGRTPVVWTQLGVSTEQARTAAADAGLSYVHNRCIMTEHAVRHH